MPSMKKVDRVEITVASSNAEAQAMYDGFVANAVSGGKGASQFITLDAQETAQSVVLSLARAITRAKRVGQFAVIKEGEPNEKKHVADGRKPQGGVRLNFLGEPTSPGATAKS